MKISYIQDMQVIEQEAWAQALRLQRYSSFHFEQHSWSEEELIDKKGQCRFVGVVWIGDTLLLALPKAVNYSEEESEEEKRQTLLKYARLLDVYFKVVRTAARTVSFKPFAPNCVENLTGWCEEMLSSNVYLPKGQMSIVAAVRFEAVYEWMLAKIFGNQLHTVRQSVTFDSVLLNQTGININQQDYSLYEWKAVHKRKNGRVEKRTQVFEDQEKENIPDIVREYRFAEESPSDYCCVIDAKYSGWDEDCERYRLPANADVYKQFFYQEQFRKLYDQNGHADTRIYNFLVLPDYMGDTEESLLRIGGRIMFDFYKEEQLQKLQEQLQALEQVSGEPKSDEQARRWEEIHALLDELQRKPTIGVMQVNMERIIEACTDAEKEKEVQEEVRAMMWLIFFKNTVLQPM